MKRTVLTPHDSRMRPLWKARWRTASHSSFAGALRGGGPSPAPCRSSGPCRAPRRSRSWRACSSRSRCREVARPPSAALRAYSRSTRSRVARAAAQHSGLPPKVLPWAPRVHFSMIRFFATTAPIGRPEPRPLARVMMSGATPQCWLANIFPVRPTPDCTSSKISRMPWRSHSSRRPGRKLVGRHEVAALALDRLDEDGRHLARRHGAREEHVLDVVEHRLSLVVAGEERPVGVGVGHQGHARAWWGRSPSAACTCSR